MPSSPIPPTIFPTYTLTLTLLPLLLLSPTTRAATATATPTLPTEILPLSTIYPSLPGPPHNTLTSYPTTYPTIPATAFSTNHFASILHITGCPAAILPSPTSFIDVNGQVTSFLSLGCAGAPVTPACQTSASTSGAFCCPGAGWTGTEFAINAILTATTTGGAQGAWCFSSFGATMSPTPTTSTTTSTATLASDTYTRDPTSVLYPGPTPTAYPTALSVSGASNLISASASSGWGNPALTVIVTAASYKNKIRQAIGTPIMASSAVVLNDLVFVRAATMASSATMTSAGSGGGPILTTGSGMASSVSLSRAPSGTSVSAVSTTSVGTATASLSTAAATSAVASVRPNGGGRMVDIDAFFSSLMMMMMMMMIIGVTSL